MTYLTNLYLENAHAPYPLMLADGHLAHTKLRYNEQN